MVDGVVTHISADASDAPNSKNGQAQTDTVPTTQPLNYKAMVTLNTQYVESDGKRHRLSPGMQVSAEIKQGERTVLEYLLSPVQKAFHESGRER